MSNEIVLMDAQAERSLTLKPIGLSELGVRELQVEEWIKENPGILGEDLLLITSEYDGFEKSDRRLDLLALDKERKLVVIELKRDVARSFADLQAIRYAAFCSTMTLEKVVSLYAEFAKIDKVTAKQNIQEFVDDHSFSALDNKPRIILAAGSFDDQEVTSCVLWLRSFGLDISCVEITPYRMAADDRIILVPRVIIPLPEAIDYIIRVEEKEAEEGRPSAAQQLFLERDEQILSYFRTQAPGKRPRTAPTGRWTQVPAGHAGVHFEWCFRGRDPDTVLEVAVHFETSSKDWNQRLCAFVEENRARLEERLGATPAFKPRGSKWYAVFIERPCEPWSEDLARWASEKMYELIEVAQPLLDEFYAKSR